MTSKRDTASISEVDMGLSQGISSTVSGVRDGTRWRKKPVEIEAVCYTAEIAAQGWPLAVTDAVPWLDEAYDTGVLANIAELNEKGAKPRFINCRLRIETLEGTLTASPGDWIIRGVKGELYACKPDVFALTYEPVDTTPAEELPGRPQDNRALLALAGDTSGGGGEKSNGSSVAGLPSSQEGSDTSTPLSAGKED